MSGGALASLDNVADTALRHLRAAIEAAGVSGLAMLVDPVLANPLKSLLESLALKPIRLHVPTGKIPQEKQPYLVWIEDEIRCERLVSASVRIAVTERLSHENDLPVGTRSLCAWFISPALTGAADAKTLAKRLAAPALQRDAHGQRHYFRFFDSRIAIELPQLLESAQWMSFAEGLGGGWHCMDEDGRMHLLGPATPGGMPRERSTGLAATEAPPSLALTPEQWQKLVCIGWRNRIEQVLPGWAPVQAPSRATVLGIAQRAVAHGLTLDEDVLAFARYAITLHPSFDRHPHVVRTLSQVSKSADDSFARLAEDWDEALVAEIGAGNWLHPQPQSTS